MALNALMDLGADPRKVLWNRSASWPDDAPNHVFAARAILSFGRVFHGDQWSDDLPGTDLVWDLPETLSLYTPLEEIRRGCEALKICSSKYQSRVELPFANLMGRWADEFPTKAEWAEAVAYVHKQAEPSWERFARFHSVARVVAEACKADKIKSFLRPAQGGEPIAKPWHFWNVEQSWRRFETCRVNPSNEYAFDSMGLSHWLFVDRKAFDEFCRDHAKPAKGPAEVPTEIERIMRSKPRGRRRGDQIDMLAGQYARMLEAGEFSQETSNREVARRLFDFAADTWENPHDEDYIRDRVAIWRQIPNRMSEE